MSDFKPPEPLTLISDGLLFLYAGFIVFLLLKHELPKKSKGEDKKMMVIWILSFLCISIFALSGAISHGTDSIQIYKIFWYPTMIFGGLSQFFFHIGVIKSTIAIQAPDSAKIHIGFAFLLVLVYFILLPIMKWMFAVFGIYLLLVSFYTLFVSRTKPGDSQTEIKTVFRKFIIILLISAVIQTIGSVTSWIYMFGPDEMYMMKPHNDIFHFIALYALYILYRGVKSE